MVRGIAKQGGTILGTSRTNPFENGGGPDVIKAHMERLGIDASSLSGGAREHWQLPSASPTRA